MTNLNQRALEIFRHIVDAYVDTGEPIGSKTLSTKLGMKLSSATIRNIMAQLETMGYLHAPHTSAGRLPTEQGLRYFVHGILETGNISKEDSIRIESLCQEKGIGLKDILEEATNLLSGLSSCAGLVIAPKAEVRLKHIEFLPLEDGKAIVVLVTMDGRVENRVIDVPRGIPASLLTQVSNFMNRNMLGLTMQEAVHKSKTDLQELRNELDAEAFNLINEGLASWSGKGKDASLIVHGQSKLLEAIEHMEQLDNIKKIFSMLETKENMLKLLEASIEGDGVQIFIGAENDLFQASGCSLVLSPFENSHGDVIGAMGVIGPTRINYGRIIPMVDYTAKMISRLLEGKED
jgi:heat-inducible transcriptional repressor